MTRGIHIAVALASAVLAGCHDEHWLTYPWDNRRVLCSDSIDDLTQTTPWDVVEDQMQVAERTRSVLTLHAHIPGVTISLAAIKHVLLMAEQHHLAYVTYREFDANALPRAGLAARKDKRGFAGARWRAGVTIPTWPERPDVQ